MTVSRPVELRVGVEIRFRAALHAVVAVKGISVVLVDAAGVVTRVRVPELGADPSFEVLSGRGAPLPRSGILEVLPAEMRENALWWERHIVEVLTGRRPDGPPGEVRPEYDPALTTLRQRELVKVEELRAAGRPVGLATLQRLWLGYQRRGVMALIDGRALRRTLPTGRVDSRVVEAVRQAIGEQADRSTGTVERVRRRTGQILQAQLGDDAPALPSQRTFYRLVERISAGGTLSDQRGHDGLWPNAPTGRSGRSPPPGRVSGCRSIPPSWTFGSCWTTA